jgi:hypothetical protein
MCAEASTVLGAVAADFFFDGCQLEVLTDVSVRHIPGCVARESRYDTAVL